MAQISSNKQLSIKQYTSTFTYETMKFHAEFFNDVIQDPFFIQMFSPIPITTNGIIKILADKRSLFQTKTNNNIENMYVSQIYQNILNIKIFETILKNRIFEILQNPYDSSDLKQLKEIEKNIVSNPTNIDLTKQKSIIEKKKESVLYVFPNIETNNMATALNSSLVSNDKKTYVDLFKRSDSNTFFLNVFKENDTIDAFKARLKQDFIDLTNKIKTKASIRLGADSREFDAYTTIILFVNETDKSIFTGYFKKELKKEYTDELNAQYKAFIDKGRNENQQFNVTTPESEKLSNIKYTDIINKLVEDINITKKSTESIIDNFTYNETINDTQNKIKTVKSEPFKNSIKQLLEILQKCYLRHTDKKFKQDITSSENTSIFNIYSRVDNLDTPVDTFELVPGKDILYKFLEMGHIPKIGYFYNANPAKNQYTFVLDPIENKKWRSKPGVQFQITSNNTWSDQFKIEHAKLNIKILDIEEEDELKKTEEEEEEQSNKGIEVIQKEDTRILVEVRNNFGKIEFKNIQGGLTDKYTGTIEFLSRRITYEQYKWFNCRMIDRTLVDTIDIKYMKDTLFDLPSLKAFLKSEKKLTDKTRLSLEFLKINQSASELIKYNNFIFENFKQNINKITSIPNLSFEEKIKKNICNIIFENNGLIYIQNSIASGKEKTEITADNYKIINYKYVSITKTKDSLDDQLNTYFKKEYTDKPETTYLKNNLSDSISDIKSKINPPKKTGAFVVIQITKDVLGDPTKLFLAAECKQRSRRIKQKFAKFTRYFPRGGFKSKKSKKTKKFNKKFNKKFKK